MSQFYQDVITEKSFRFLAALKKQYEFILIGGWAVFLYTHSLKSKDIDIIVDYETLGKLKEAFSLYKNERLRKYEIKTEDFDVDIYLPYYSDLGIDIEKVKKTAITREGFLVPQLEILLILKIYAWVHRRGSIKGQKDELDIFSLAFLPEFDWKIFLNLIKENNLEEARKNFIALLKATKNIDELNINNQQISRFRKKILNLIS
jgi:hypothetical protein